MRRGRGPSKQVARSGMRFMSCNSEVGFLLHKAMETVAALRGEL